MDIWNDNFVKNQALVLWCPSVQMKLPCLGARGALIGVAAGAAARDWWRKYLIVIAAGLVAGESLMGVIEARVNLLS